MEEFHIAAEMVEAGGQPEDMTQAQIAEYRETCNRSLYMFCWYIMGFRDMSPELHRDLCAYIELWGTVPEPETDPQGYKRIMTQIPRGHLKSSIGTMANALWQICRDPSSPVAIINETEVNTSGWLGAIRGVVESSRLFRMLYGDLLPRGVAVEDTRSKSHALKWNDSRLDFEGRRPSDPEGSITGWGGTSATTGHHWPKIIMDDLISVKHKQSALEMQRVVDWALTHTELMRPTKGGWAYVNCTPWTFKDVYVHFSQDYGYLLYRRAALENADGVPDINGEPIFHLMQKGELLNAAKRDWATFSSQLMCMPLPAGEMSLRPEWIRWFRVEKDSIWIEPQDVRPNETARVPISRLRKAIFLDPAASEPSEIRKSVGSRNGIVVEGIDPYGRRFILESAAVRVAPPDVIDAVFKLAIKWQVDRVYVEEVAFSVLFRHWILQLQQPGQKWAGYRLVPIGVRPGKAEKCKRIMDKAVGFERGDYYFNRVGCTALHNEYLTWHPESAEQDTMDALSYDGHLYKPVSETQEAERRHEQLSSNVAVCPITGYFGGLPQ